MITPDWFSSDVAVWLVQSLAHVLWQGFVLLIIAGVAEALLAKRSSQTRYALWSIALLLIFCCLPANLVVLAPSLAETAALSQPDGVHRPTEELASVPDTGSSTLTGTDSARTTSVVNPATQAADTAVFAGPTDEDVQRTGTVAAGVPHAPVEAGNVWQAAAPFTCIVYVFGVGIMLFRLLLAAGGTRRLRRSGRPIDDPRLLERLDSLARRVGLRVRPLVATSAKVAVPVVVGIMKPVIMLPGCVLSGLDPAQLEAILLHELAHIRRCDPLINLLQRCAETVLFFQPAVWIVSRRMRMLREDCCDDIVLQCEVPQCLYAETLVAVSELREGRTPGQALALAAVNPDERSLRRRVLRILGESQGTGPLRVTRGAVLTLAALVVLSLSPVLLLLQGHATGQDGDKSPHSEAIKKLIGNDPGESIYNDKLKRFKFRLEKVEVRTAETAKAFCSLYRDGEQATGRPKLIGAWGDPLTNSIVVIGPPEAEQAIRETLAEWESAMVGIEGLDETLEVKQEYLHRERRTLIHEIASIELVVVEIDNAGGLPDSDKRMKAAKERLRAFESELQRVEQQLEVISRNIRRRDGVSGSETDSPDGQPAPRGMANRQPSDKKTDPVLTTAHAVVLWRNDGVVWINRGTADRMKRGLRLNVTSSIGGPAKPQLFGRIEITRIVSEHLSEARVLQEERGRPIAKGHQITWLAEVRQIPLTLAPLEAGTVILQDHIGMGPWPVTEIPADTQLSAPDFIGRVVRNRIDVVQPIREQDLYRRGELPSATGISFNDLKLVDEKVPEPIRRLIGRHVTISGLMYPPIMDTGIKRFVLSADRQINYFARKPEPHELVSVQLAPGLSTDYVQDAIRVFGVLGTETLAAEDGGGIRYALKAARISDVSPKSEATGTSPPATLGQQQSPQAVTQVGSGPDTSNLPAAPGAKPTKVELKFAGPRRAVVHWPNESREESAPDSRPYVLPATIPAITGKTVAFPVTDLPGRKGLQLFASLEVAPLTPRTSVYVRHNSIPLEFSEEDIDQAVSGNLVTKVVFLPRPEFQELALAGVETLVTTRLDPGVDPVAEAQQRGWILAVLRLGNRQTAQGAPARPRVHGRVVAVKQEEGADGVTFTFVEISVGSDDGIGRDDRLRIYRTSLGQGRVYPFVAEIVVRLVTPGRAVGEVIRRVHPTIEVEADDLVTLPYSALNVGGTVVGLKQQPLAGVDVWLQSDYGTGAATHVTTDARGRFSLHVSRAAFNSAGWKTAILWVYRDGHELFVRNLSDLRMEDPDDRLLDQIIGLDAEPESALTVIARDDGTALAGVRVVPYCLRLRDELYPTLPPRLQAKLVRTTDGDGRVVIRGVPHHNLFDVRLETADRGTHEFNLRLDGYDETDRTIQLGSVGSITGQVTADDPSVLQDLTLYFRTSDPAWSESRFADADSESLKRMLRESDWSDLPRRSQGVATVKVSPDGRFTIPALATGRLRMHTSLSADLPFGVRMSQVPVVIEAGQTMTLPMHSAPRVTVRSSLTDEDSNEVTSRTVLRIDDGEGLHDDHVIFKGGQFETQVLAGDVRFVIENLLDERDGTWTQLDGLPFAVADDDEEPVELPAIRIQIQRNTSNR